MELQYVEAKIVCNGVEVTTLERNKPILIPAFNPQQQFIEKNLTENEMKSLKQPDGTFFRIDGMARVKAAESQELNVPFTFMTAAWLLPTPASATE